MTRTGLDIVSDSGPGVLHQITGAIALHQANIETVEIVEERPPTMRVYFEIDVPGEPSELKRDIDALPVSRIPPGPEQVESLQFADGQLALQPGVILHHQQNGSRRGHAASSKMSGAGRTMRKKVRQKPASLGTGTEAKLSASERDGSADGIALAMREGVRGFNGLWHALSPDEDCANTVS